jgi:hypothetical protein
MNLQIGEELLAEPRNCPYATIWANKVLENSYEDLRAEMSCRENKQQKTPCPSWLQAWDCVDYRHLCLEADSWNLLELKTIKGPGKTV